MRDGGVTWYPSCWVRLKIRFEDYEKESPPDLTPEIPSTDPVDYGFRQIEKELIPTQCNVTRNSYRNADEVRVTLPYAQLPLDPRTIRAASIEVYQGSVEPQVWGDSVGPLYGESRTARVGEVQVLATGADADGDEFTLFDPNLSNEVFRGYVDDWEIIQDGDDAVSITARDLTALLIDAEMPTQGLVGIPKDLPLDQVVKLIIAGDPTAQVVPPPNAFTYPQRIDSKRDVRRLRNRLAYVTQKLQAAQAAAVTDPTPPLVRELQRLTAKQTDILARLATAESVAAAADAIPIVAQRYGLPAFRGLRVVNATERFLPTLGEIKPPTYFDSAGGPKKARSGGSSDQISYWDFVTDLVVSAGYICYFRTPTEAPDGGSSAPAELVIDEPRTYYPEANREVRSFIYGYNVDSLSINRSFTGKAVPTGIAVSAIEAKTGFPISVRFPENPLVNRPGANQLQLGDTAEYRSVLLDDRIPGDNARETLLRVAESLYQQFARGEFLVEIETTTLGAFRRNLEPGGEADMFQLQAGDPISIEVLPSIPDPVNGQPFFTQAGDFQALGVEEKARRLVEAFGFSREAAAAAALSADSNLIQDLFYVKEVAINFDYQSGFAFTIQAINYVSARNAIQEQREAAGATDELVRLLEGLGV